MVRGIQHAWIENRDLQNEGFEKGTIYIIPQNLSIKQNELEIHRYPNTNTCRHLESRQLGN